jgi:hypothetical protein
VQIVTGKDHLTGSENCTRTAHLVGIAICHRTDNLIGSENFKSKIL